MDVDAFIATHRDEWSRLESLTRAARRPRRLAAADVDELVRLYQRAATHLSIIQTRSPDPVLLGRLSRLVSDSRAAVIGTHASAWRDVAQFVTVGFPVAVYRARAWWVSAAVIGLLVATAFAWWIAAHPSVQAALVPPAEVRQLTDSQFVQYYRSAPAHDFVLHVWTNNVWVSAVALIGGFLLGLPTIFALFVNMLNVGVDGGYMIAAGKTGVFFGLIVPHGLLELTAVFIASGAGLRLGWTIIAPGPRTRPDALAVEGRSMVGISLGLIGVLAVSGAIEGFVTPSGLPTWLRVAIGIVVEIAFLTYIWVLGRRGVRRGETGDLDEAGRGVLVEAAG